MVQFRIWDRGCEKWGNEGAKSTTTVFPITLKCRFHFVYSRPRRRIDSFSVCPLARA